MAECLNRKLEVDIVKCGICLSTFTKPILLSCFHIFCTPCVTKLTEGKRSLICPLCRAEHMLPDNGVDGLTLYPYTQEGSPSDTNVISLCQMCGNGKNLVSKCIDCNNIMCLECNAYHLKHLTFKTHKTEKIQMRCAEIRLPETNMIIDDTCETHQEEVSLFCESCNRAICTECKTTDHIFHKIKHITFPVQKRRHFLQSAISAMESKITALNQEKEIFKFEEKIFYKLCRQGKEELKTHATRSKENVCKIIDVLADINLQKMDELQKQEIKALNTHQDELERKKLSLQCLQRSTEDIVNLSSNGKLFNHYAFLYPTLTKAIKQDNTFTVSIPQFCSGNPIEHTYIEKCFGKVIKRKQHSTANESETHIYSLPLICDVTGFTKVTSFNISDIVSLFGICENKAWIHVAPRLDKCVKLYSVNDSEPIATLEVKITDKQHIQRATENELWVINGSVLSRNTIDEGTSIKTEVIIRLPKFEDITFSLIDENRVVAFSKNDKCFYEVKIDGDRPVTVNDTTLKTIPADDKLADLITTEPFMITVTLSNNILLTCKNKVITLDRNFNMYNVHENKGSDFKGICGDPYGNIFIADYALSKICLFNSNGDFIHHVSMREIKYPVNITRDSVGNIWCADNFGGRVMVLSYL